MEMLTSRYSSLASSRRSDLVLLYGFSSAKGSGVHTDCKQDTANLDQLPRYAKLAMGSSVGVGNP